jgi:riboflavin synthase
MFTGIIEEIGIVKSATTNHLAIEAKIVLENIRVGDSIAINGVCLTVTSIVNNSFDVDLMMETIRYTGLGKLRYGNQVNLERAITLEKRLGGHLVLGHVDDIGTILSIDMRQTDRIIKIAYPTKLMRYISFKGFIAVDGISLTVTDVDASSFSVSLVNHTLKHTTLGSKSPGDNVNLEIDVIARYLERLSKYDNREPTMNLLREYGYIQKG